MRRGLRQVSKHYKKATEVEKTEISDLRDNIREQLKVTRGAERSRRRRETEQGKDFHRTLSNLHQGCLVVKGQES